MAVSMRVILCAALFIGLGLAQLNAYVRDSLEIRRSFEMCTERLDCGINYDSYAGMKKQIKKTTLCLSSLKRHLLEECRNGTASADSNFCKICASPNIGYSARSGRMCTEQEVNELNDYLKQNAADLGYSFAASAMCKTGLGADDLTVACGVVVMFLFTAFAKLVTETDKSSGAGNDRSLPNTREPERTTKAGLASSPFALAWIGNAIHSFALGAYDWTNKALIAPGWTMLHMTLLAPDHDSQLQFWKTQDNIVFMTVLLVSGAFVVAIALCLYRRRPLLCATFLMVAFTMFLAGMYYTYCYERFGEVQSEIYNKLIVKIKEEAKYARIETDVRPVGVPGLPRTCFSEPMHRATEGEHATAVIYFQSPLSNACVSVIVPLLQVRKRAIQANAARYVGFGLGAISMATVAMLVPGMQGMALATLVGGGLMAGGAATAKHMAAIDPSELADMIEARRLYIAAIESWQEQKQISYSVF